VRNFCVFFLEKRLQNLVPKVFIVTPIDVVVFKFREIWPTGNRWNRALFTDKIFLARLKLLLLRGSRPKSVSNVLKTECSRYYPNRFAFGVVLAEHVNTVKLPRKVNPIFGRSVASSWINISDLWRLGSFVIVDGDVTIWWAHMNNCGNSWSQLNKPAKLWWKPAVRLDPSRVVFRGPAMCWGSWLKGLDSSAI